MKYLILILALSGCATMESAPTSPYQAGQYHGCASGKAAAGNWTYQFRPDVNAYVSDPQYKAGWDTWFMQCKTETEQFNANTRGAIR